MTTSRKEGFRPGQKEIFTAIGAFVVMSQTLENLLRLLLTFVLQDGKPLTLARLEELNAAHRKKTLGQFLAELKKRADYYEPLEETFDRYLENRNTLIHRFNEVPGNDMHSAEDFAALSLFINQLIADMKVLLHFFMAWLVAWSKQVGIPCDFPSDRVTEAGQTFISDIQKLAPLIDSLVYAKESGGAATPN